MPNVCEANGATSNNANVCFTYGTSAASYNNGLPLTMTDASGSESYTYNSLEQLTQLQKVISGTTYMTSYAYNLANELTQITYPSGHVVLQGFDAVGRLCAVGTTGSTCSTGTTYATGFTYNAAQLPTAFNYGNGVAASFGYSPDRLQLTSLSYAKSGTTLFGLAYSYGTSGSNDGLISGITDSVQAGRSVSYTYDSLARLSTALTTGSASYPQWGLSWTYDRYANRTAQAVTAGTGPSNSVNVSATTNQLGSPYAYDASGNMTNDGLNTLAYDGENRVTSATNSSTSGTYTYDGGGLRVQKVAGATTTVYVFSGSKVIAEYDNGTAPTAPSREYVYSGAILLAKIDSTGTHYYHQDLVSNRLVTDSSGNVAEQLGHYPYGESWYNATNDKLFFTTYERDSESGNDYAQARYYVSRVARFSAVDPIGGAIGDAQSNNGYAYTENDPVNLVDPSGAIMIVAPYPFSPDPFLPWGPFGGFGGGQILPCGSISEDDGFDSIFTDPTSGINYVTSNCYGTGQTGASGGGGGIEVKIPPPPPPPHWKDCLKALREDPNEQFSPSLLRATNNWDALQSAGAANGVDPALLASIALQESGFQPNAIQSNGLGVGAFQIDLGQNPNVTVAQATNVAWAANWAGGNIAHSYNLYVNRYGSVLATAGAIRNYNGTGGVPTSTLLATGYVPYLDIGTNPPLNNYVSSVINIYANCF